jgi:hypothetical protein
MEVVATHCNVAQLVVPIDADCVAAGEKFVPKIESVVEPVIGQFDGPTFVKTGASYEKGEPGSVPELNDPMSEVDTTITEVAVPAPKE